MMSSNNARHTHTHIYRYADKVAGWMNSFRNKPDDKIGAHTHKHVEYKTVYHHEHDNVVGEKDRSNCHCVHKHTCDETVTLQRTCINSFKV